ncbi:MAG TPA: hypothetical protein VNI83_04590 [Vicinamibacterales bacterium]|nr:hypothetical protein [Vicinamibacterales bacterium]
MARVGEILAILRLRNELSPELRKAQRDLRDTASQLTALGKTLTVGITVPVAAAGAALAKLGMDAIESENLVSVAFGDMRQAADRWSKQLSQSLGLNQFELRKTAATLFTMTSSMGIGKEAAFEMSTGLVQLAHDMASFRNMRFEDALDKIRAGLTGEAEPLKRLGILVDEATVKTYAYRTGLAKQGEELTEQQKVLARYRAILAQTTHDQGDLARTLDSPTNQLRRLRNQIQEAATSLGIALMPIVQQVISGVSRLVPWLQHAVKWFTDLPAPVRLGAVAILGLAAAAGPLLLVLGQLVSTIATLIPLLAGTGGVAGLAGAFGAAGAGALRQLGPLGAVLGIVLAMKEGLEWLERKGALVKSPETADLLNKNIASGFYARPGGRGVRRDIQLPLEQSDVAKLVEQAEQEAKRLQKLAEEEQRQRAAAAAAREHARALQEIRDQLTGEGVIRQIERMHEAFGGVLPIEQLTRDQAADLHRVLQEGIAIYEARGQVAPRIWQLEAAAAASAAGILRRDVAEAQAAVAKGFAGFTGLAKAPLLGTRDLSQALMGPLPTAVGTFQRPLVQRLFGGLGQTLRENLGPTILQAFTGGGSALKGLGGLLGGQLGQNLAGLLGKGLTGALGKTLGSAIGSIIPGVGTLLGGLAAPLLGKIGGFFRGLFGKSQGRILDERATAEIGQLRDQFVAAHGGMEQLRRTAQLLGSDILASFGHKGRKGLELFKQDMAAFEERLAKVKAAGPEITRLLERVGTVAGALPERFRPVLEQLAEIGVISREALTGVFDATRVDVERMRSAAQKYGIELEALGPRFQAARIAETARTILEDFDLLTMGGREVGGVLEGMRDEIQQLVIDSLKFGVAIPANFKPLLEQLLATGQLVDQNGQRLTDLSQIKFADPIKVGIEAIVERLDQLLIGLGIKLPEAITSGVNAAVDQAGRLAHEIGIAIERIPRHVPIDVGLTPTGEGGALPMQHGGIVTRPTLALLAERGPEAVIPLARGGGPLTIRVPIYLDGRQIAEATVPWLPAVVRRHGLAA